MCGERFIIPVEGPVGTANPIDNPQVDSVVWSAGIEHCGVCPRALQGGAWRS